MKIPCHTDSLRQTLSECLRRRALMSCWQNIWLSMLVALGGRNSTDCSGCTHPAWSAHLLHRRSIHFRVGTRSSPLIHISCMWHSQHEYEHEMSHVEFPALRISVIATFRWILWVALLFYRLVNKSLHPASLLKTFETYPNAANCRGTRFNGIWTSPAKHSWWNAVMEWVVSTPWQLAQLPSAPRLAVSPRHVTGGERWCSPSPCRRGFHPLPVLRPALVIHCIYKSMK